MHIKTSISELKTKIQEIQDYLGPRINYSTNSWPVGDANRWLLEYMIELKHEYYKRKKRQNKYKDEQSK